MIDAAALGETLVIGQSRCANILAQPEHVVPTAAELTGQPADIVSSADLDVVVKDATGEVVVALVEPIDSVDITTNPLSERDYTGSREWIPVSETRRYRASA